MESTIQTPLTTSAVGIRYGLLTGLVSVLISFGLNTAHLEQSPLKWLGAMVLIAGIMLAQREFKQRDGGFMSYGQGLGVGVIVSAVAGVLGSVFTYVYMTMIDPELVTRLMDKARADMEARGGLTDAQIDQAMAMSAKFTSAPVLTIFALIGSIIIGLIISLVTSAIIKNTRPEFE